ncbi:MAG: hypothetical protein QOH35_2514, partial [Acidobacteriaceae bacterium]|nr:hypothetical protein [Acidobacteriaceae bacterium]
SKSHAAPNASVVLVIHASLVTVLL